MGLFFHIFLEDTPPLLLRPSPGEAREQADEHGDHLQQNTGPKSTLYEGVIART